MQVLKIILIVILTLAFLIGGCTLWVGYTAKKVIEEAATEGVDTGLQTLTITSEGANITTSLLSEPSITLIGVELCQTPPELMQSSQSYSCLNGLCQTVISIKGVALPQDLTINRKHKDTCVDQTIPQISNYITNTYVAKIGITDADKAKIQLGESDSLERSPNSKYGSSSSIGFNGTKTITLDYGATSPTSDEFKLGDKLIHVNYVPNTAPNNPTPSATEE